MRYWLLKLRAYFKELKITIDETLSFELCESSFLTEVTLSPLFLNSLPLLSKLPPRPSCHCEILLECEFIGSLIGNCLDSSAKVQNVHTSQGITHGSTGVDKFMSFVSNIISRNEHSRLVQSNIFECYLRYFLIKG
ncbi:uncharacterized protein LOC116404065 isoform X3 [Cucumis sativus]|nr:uncharacterized protein LOC116404065 isoform X3 [Cucumis sativus]